MKTHRACVTKTAVQNLPTRIVLATPMDRSTWTAEDRLEVARIQYHATSNDAATVASARKAKRWRSKFEGMLRNKSNEE